MTTFDQLDAEQRAVIELVLKSGRSYDTLADMLGFTPSRVRELAREALTELSPTTATMVDPEWRGQLTDYVLGQQSGPESTATQGHLRRSEGARVWAYSLIDSLDHLYADGVPAIPAAEDGGTVAPRRERVRRERARPLREEKPAREPARRPAAVAEPLSPEAQAVVRRRRLVGGGILLAVVAGVVILIVALSSGGGSNNKKSSTSASSTQPTKVLGELALAPQNGIKGRGIGVIAQRGNQRQLFVSAALPASNKGEAYLVWLYNGPRDNLSVGGQAANSKGQFQGVAPLPANYQRYKFVQVTRQKIAPNTTYGGTPVLQGALANLVTPQQAQQQQQQQGGGGAGTGTTPTPTTPTTPTP